MKAKLIYWNGIFAIIIAILISVNCIAISYDNILRVFMGSTGGVAETFEDSAYATVAELRDAQEEFSVELMTEGAVILKNEENALPLDSSNLKVSLFGQNSVNLIRGGTGSSQVSSGEYGDIKLNSILSEKGFKINENLWNYYENHSKRTTETGGDYKCYESTWEEISQADGVNASFAEYNDVALVVISRLGSEAADLPPVNPVSSGGDGETSYLALTPNEKNMLKGIRESGLFEKTVVVLNTGNAMQLDFLSETEYGIDGCILFGMPGVYGAKALPDILLGNSDPSGHLNDTYVYNANSSPAARNVGDARYVNASISAPSDTRSTIYEANNYGSAEYSYVNYAEGIYVGYKYYETRYEDVVLGRNNVGDYDYAKEVVFPFGYGNSYTTFVWSDFSMTVEGEEIVVQVTVTNSGAVAGKDVVEVYFQAPYISGGVEKASVNLAGIAKTKLLEPNAQETVTIRFDAKDTMKSYDNTCEVQGRNERGAYILDAGTYYVTAAKDAHEAINNVLSKKAQNGVSVDVSKMTAAGNTAFVSDRYEVTQKEIIHNDTETGKEIMNLFDDAIAPEANESTYLSRSNWAVLDDPNGLKYSTGNGYLIGKSKSTGKVVSTVTFETREASDDLLARIKAVGWNVAGRPDSANDNAEVIFNAESEALLQNAQGEEFSAPVWNDILNRLSLNDLKNSFLNGAFSTVEFTSIEKPATIDLDGPSGITNYTNGHGGFGFPPTSTLGRSFNVELAEEYGKLLAEDGLRMGVYGWYAPNVNMNRTPFNARSYESYSEDAFLTGQLASKEILGCRSKGMYVYVKHFALNEQGANRNYICTWGQEQAFREIYFKPFEMCVKEGNATGIMASMNRIGAKLARGDYNLLTALLKEEWGFKGAVITDAITYGSSVAHTEQALAAGVDLMLNSTKVSLSNELLENNYAVNRLKDATHRICYMVVNSAAFDLIENKGIPYYVLLLILLDSLTLVAIAVSESLLIRKAIKEKKQEKLGRKEKL